MEVRQREPLYRAALGSFLRFAGDAIPRLAARSREIAGEGPHFLRAIDPASVIDPAIPSPGSPASRVIESIQGTVFGYRDVTRAGLRCYKSDVLKAAQEPHTQSHVEVAKS